MKKTKHLVDSKFYKRFITQRDQALEKILRNTQLKITDILNEAFSQIIYFVKAKYPELEQSHGFVKNKVKNIELNIEKIFEKPIYDIISLYIQLRKKTYMLSYAGEVEAIRQAIDISTNHKLKRQDLPEYSQEEIKALINKLNLYFYKIARSIQNEIHTSLVLGDNTERTIGKIYMRLPKKKAYPSKKVLKKVVAKEAGKDKKNFEFQSLFFDQGTWEQVLKDYEDDYIPINRSPELVFDIKNPWNDNLVRETIPSKDAFYGWEVERDITHEFVKSVREGQIKAANDNGINEFLWIAILDDKTCENCCGEFGCADFDGHTSKEIEEMTKGEYSTAPAHFYCRCTMAPVTKDFVAYDISQTEKDFEEWLYPNKET